MTELLESSPTFDDPLGMLSACHRRIERALEVMERIAAIEAVNGLDERARAALQQTLHYFATSVSQHAADEEESLFPRVQAALGNQDPLAARALHALAAEHSTLDAAHRELEQLGKDLLESGRFAFADRRTRFRELVARIRELYREHIRAEDEDLFPLAAEVVEPEDLEAVGTEMAARRGINWGRHCEVVAGLRSRPWDRTRRGA